MYYARKIYEQNGKRFTFAETIGEGKGIHTSGILARTVHIYKPIFSGCTIPKREINNKRSIRN